jgi:transposase-like protein
MSQWHEFVMLFEQEGVNRRELGRRFGVSPTIGYRLWRAGGRRARGAGGPVAPPAAFARAQLDGDGGLGAGGRRAGSLDSDLTQANHASESSLKAPQERIGAKPSNRS